MRLFRSTPPAAPQEGALKPPVGSGALWSEGFGRVATRSIQTLAVLALVSVVIYGIMQLTLVFIPVTIALILSAAIHPVVSWMRRKGVPSILATWIALIGILVVLGAVVWLIVLTVRAQWDDLVSQVSDGVAQVTAWVESLPFDVSSYLDSLDLESVWESVSGFLTSSGFSQGALAGVSATASFFTGLVLMIVVLFFFLKDGPQIWEFLLRPFNGENYERARRVGDKAVDVLGGYVRGTATVAAVDAIGIGVGLAILQIPLTVPLAVIVFLTAFIPMVGATAAGILAALVALVTHGPVAALIVVGIVVLVNQLEGNFLQPVVMARSLKLHALVILLALTAGTILGGIVGAVLAVPLTAVAWGVISVWDGPSTPARIARKKRTEKA